MIRMDVLHDLVELCTTTFEVYLNRRVFAKFIGALSTIIKKSGVKSPNLSTRFAAT